MGRKLTPFETELYQRTDEVLHYVWDPIGISAVPQARDEYDAYLPQVFAMLLDAKSEGELSAYLSNVEDERMGLTPHLENANSVATVLIEWVETLKAKHAED